MNPTISKDKSTRSSSLVCRVCGDIAHGTNFSAVTCMSCKVFFRRHAEAQLVTKRCYFDGQCHITQISRKYCAPCRLKRCFQVGMDPQLIRHCQQQNGNRHFPKPTTVSLLSRDRSMLTVDEWTLLSNIINTYDEQDLFIKNKEFFTSQFSLPPKLRCKDSYVLNHIGSLFSTSYTFIERCPLFYSLPHDIRKILIERNLGAVGSFNGLFMSKELNVFDNEVLSRWIDNIYGHGHSHRARQACQRLDQNGILIKIILLMIIFSNNCTVVSFHHSENIQLLFHTQILLHTENIIVTMLWKYLIYQYGFRESVLRYVSLIKSVLDMLQRMGNALDTQRHQVMVANIVEKKTRLLSLEDNLLID